jgi:hypothetical protein
MLYRIPRYLKDLKRMLGAFPTLDSRSRLVVVLGITGALVLGVFIVEALFRLFVLVLVLVALGLGVRLWWQQRAMPTAEPGKGAVGRAIEGQYVVIKKQTTRRKRRPSQGSKRV